MPKIYLLSKKKKINIVYSTNPDYNYNYEEDGVEETLDVSEQNLRVLLDKKQRKGKAVTLVTGFIGKEEDLKDLGKSLKQKCGVGGSVKDGLVLIQGDVRKKVLDILLKEGYKAKQSGG